MRTFSLHSTDASDFWMGYDGTSQTVYNRLWWVLWHANELNALQRPPTDSKPNTWASRMGRPNDRSIDRSIDGSIRLAMWLWECREDRGGRWVGGWDTVFGSPSVAISGGYYINTFHKKGEDNNKEKEEEEQEKHNRSVLRLSEPNWRTTEGNENRKEKKQQDLFIVKNAFVLMPRKTHRKLTGWLCGCSSCSSSSHLSKCTRTRTHMSITSIDRYIYVCVTS